MNQDKHVAPEYWKTAFHCLICNAYAQQSWSSPGYSGHWERVKSATCEHCRESSFWVDGKLAFPRQITAPLAHDDMPGPVLEYYNEAREVSVSSSRAAAALLRIAAKKLCESLGENDPNLNRAIGNLRKKGLPQSVIQSLDTVRIIGNEGGAHEGQIDLTGEDNKEVQSMFSSLPENKKQGVEDRDKQKN